MPVCKIENCKHRAKGSSTVHRLIGVSWSDHGICTCCAIELVDMGVISGGYRPSYSCKGKIADELKKLQMEDRIKNNPEQIAEIKIKKKKRWASRNMRMH